MAHTKDADLQRTVEEFARRSANWRVKHPRLPDDEPYVDLPIAGPRPWLVTARFVIREGRPVIRDLHIVATNKQRRKTWDIPSEGLTTGHLRKIPMPNALRWDMIRKLFNDSGIPVVTTVEGRMPKAKNSITDDEVASFAADYIAAKQNPKHPNPRSWLRQEYERRGKVVSAHYVPDMIRRAADRGFLTEARYAGDRKPREATPKLDSWIDEHRPPRKPRSRKKG